MMNDYSGIVEAIDRLAEAINQNSYPFASECLSTILATAGSVVAVLVFELIKNRILAPRDEFRKLQRRTNSTLSMYAHYYSNPVNKTIPMVSEKTQEDYINAATELRRLAVDVTAFADERKREKCCGIEVKNIREAGSLLIGLSNNFFTISDCLERDYNQKRADDIKKLLGLGQKK